MKKYRVVNKSRFVISMVLIAFLVFGFSFSTIVDAKENDTKQLIPVYVQPGDTIWSISQKYCAENKDIRVYIEKVMEINDLKTASIASGSTLYFIQD